MKQSSKTSSKGVKEREQNTRLNKLKRFYTVQYETLSTERIDVQDSDLQNVHSEICSTGNRCYYEVCEWFEQMARQSLAVLVPIFSHGLWPSYLRKKSQMLQQVKQPQKEKICSCYKRHFKRYRVLTLIRKSLRCKRNSASALAKRGTASRYDKISCKHAGGNAVSKRPAISERDGLFRSGKLKKLRWFCSL